MKNLIIIVSLLGLVACGGGSGGSADNGSGGTDDGDAEASPSLSAEGAPEISSISGTGTDGIVFDSINVTGSNFESDEPVA